MRDVIAGRWTNSPDTEIEIRPRAEVLDFTRIDLAVAAIMAHSRAADLARRPAPSIYVG